MNDLRFALRQLLKNPGFTAVAALTLALGIGANTAIFSFVNASLLKPLPYRDPDRLVMLFENNLTHNFHKMTIGAPILGEWRRQTTVFEGIAAMGWGEFTLTGNGAPEKLQGRLLSANAFSLLGLRPVLGRDFAPEEEVHGNHQVILLSHETWQRRFGSDPEILGKVLTINGDPCVVIGVMPPRTQFPDPNLDFWMPLAFDQGQLSNRHGHTFRCFGKLKAGATLEQARSEMSTVAKRMEVDEPNRGWGAEVFPMQEIMVGDSRQALLLLLGSVGLVLVIGCSNIANLLLTRASARSHEFGIRLALGASPGRIIRQLLTESVALSLLGGVAGVGLAFAALKGMIRFIPWDFLRGVDTVTLDGATLLFTLTVTVVAGMLFGLAPALQVANPSLLNQMREASRGNSSGVHRHRLRSALVVSEVALSLILLVGAGLFIRSFSRLITQHMGFNPENLVAVDLGLSTKSYPQHADRERFFTRFLEQIRGIPGGETSALSSGVPFTGQLSSLYTRIRDLPDPKPGDAISANYSQVSPGYFKTMNIPLLAGRDFANDDRTNTPAVLIVDQTFVKIFHLGTNIIGRHVRVGDGTEHGEIIGLVEDVKRSDMAAAPKGELYRPFRQNCWGRMTLAVRTQQDPAVWTRAIRAELDKLDKDIPMENIHTVTQLVSSSVSQRKFSAQLLTGFASVALLLAAIGIYGVLADNVSQRTHEIGIRVALGARQQDVLSLVMGQGMKLALTGVLVGTVGALMMTRVLQKMLFDIQPTDPLTFAVVAIVLVAIASLACWLPARRAAKLDPMVALRTE